MPEPSRDPSVFDEPQHSGRPAHPDSTEVKTGRTLPPEDPDAVHASGQGVWDEPDMFPGRAAEVIWRDWSCSKCSYNLRGLEVGHPCPECGHRELYRPPPMGQASYQSWLEQRITRTSPAVGWYVTLAAVVGGGLLAVLGAFLGAMQPFPFGTSAPIMAIVFGPAIEEVMKIAAATSVVELRPYLFRRQEQIRVACVGAALVFAAIENLVYLNIYYPNPGTVHILWRWTVCVLLHTGCSFIAANGLIITWRRTMQELRRPLIAQALPALGLAILVHGAYNLLAILFDYRF